MKLQKLVFVHYNMQLKLRQTMRRSQDEIEQSFNPINLDYIFEEDDPLNPWLEEREVSCLDDQDNSRWLEVEEDDDAQPLEQASDDANTASSSAEKTQSDDEGGLSPPSEDGGGNDGGGNEIQQPYRHGYDTGESVIPETYAGEHGMDNYLDNYDMGIPPSFSPSRRAGPSSGGRHRQILDSSGMVQNFDNFGLEESSSSGASYLPYAPPCYPQSLPQQPHNVLPSYLVNFDEQEAQGMNLGYFNYIMPQGWTDDSQSQTRSNDRDEYEEPARHSVWW